MKERIADIKWWNALALSVSFNSHLFFTFKPLSCLDYPLLSHICSKCFPLQPSLSHFLFFNGPSWLFGLIQNHCLISYRVCECIMHVFCISKICFSVQLDVFPDCVLEKVKEKVQGKIYFISSNKEWRCQSKITVLINDSQKASELIIRGMTVRKIEEREREGAQ